MTLINPLGQKMFLHIHSGVRSVKQQLQHKEILRNCCDVAASRKGQNMWIPSYSEGCILMKKNLHLLQNKVLGKEGLSLS